MRLLITGGCGFVGSNLAGHALARGDELTVLDNLSREGASQNLDWLHKQGEFRFVQADVRSRGAVDEAIREARPDCLFHLAGQVAMTASLTDPRTDFDTNALGTLNVLDSVRAHAPEAIVIYSSTNKVYGDLRQYNYRETTTRYECVEKPQGFDELTPLDFHSPYGCSKGAADQYVLDYARVYGLRTVVFRHSSMYGGRQFATYDQGWLGWFCQQAVQQKFGKPTKPLTVSGNGKQVRDILHINDVNRLYFAAAENVGRACGEAFNIGGGIHNSLSLLELFDELKQRLDTELEYTQISPRVSDQKVFVADIAKSIRCFGWEPEVRLAEGIQLAIDWAAACVRHV